MTQWINYDIAAANGYAVFNNWSQDWVKMVAI